MCHDVTRTAINLMTQDLVLPNYVIGLVSAQDSAFNLSDGISRELENEMEMPEDGLKEVNIKNGFKN